MYPRRDFRGDEGYAAFAMQTYFAGRHLLRSYGLECSGRAGIVAVSSRDRAEELRHKASLLRLSAEEFRELGRAEATFNLGHFHDDGCSYFTIPDAPFDGAMVLGQMRQQAVEHGTKFVEVSEPVVLEPAGSATRVRFDRTDILSSLTFVAAGSGSVPLLAQLGHDLDCNIRRTPLLVTHSRCFLPASIYIDLDRGFSAVRHPCGTEGMATVIGTRAKTEPVRAGPPDKRTVSDTEREELLSCLHPKMSDELGDWRVTAGEELIPGAKPLTQYEPWIEDFGNVVFGSPGRATVSMLAAVDVFARLRPKKPGRSAKARLIRDGLAGWTGPIRMHFTPDYNFDDSERSP